MALVVVITLFASDGSEWSVIVYFSHEFTNLPIMLVVIAIQML